MPTLVTKLHASGGHGTVRTPAHRLRAIMLDPPQPNVTLDGGRHHEYPPRVQRT
eukprot:gene4432-biopygen3526